MGFGDLVCSLVVFCSIVLPLIFLPMMWANGPCPTAGLVGTIVVYLLLLLLLVILLLSCCCRSRSSSYESINVGDGGGGGGGEDLFVIFVIAKDIKKESGDGGGSGNGGGNCSPGFIMFFCCWMTFLACEVGGFAFVAYRLQSEECGPEGFMYDATGFAVGVSALLGSIIILMSFCVCLM